jgi:hypothetical protein
MSYSYYNSDISEDSSCNLSVEISQNSLRNNGSPSANDMLIFSSTGVNLRSRVRTFLNDFKLFGLMFCCCWFGSQSFTKFPQCNRFLIRSKILYRIFFILQALFWDLAMNCPEGISQKHQILSYVSFFVTILLPFRFNSSLTRSLRNSRVSKS